MQTSIKNISDTKVKITITASSDELSHVKSQVVEKQVQTVKVPGFREGKVPPVVVEKHLDQNYLQGEVLNEALSHLYSDAVNQNKLHIVSQPKVELKKFVPFTALEFEVEVDVIGKITLPDYKKLTAKKPEVKVTVKDVDGVLQRMQTQMADFKEVDRPVQKEDRVFINFEGKDDKGEPVSGAKGDNYPLVIGSNTFIPGFEENVIGISKDQEKEFLLTFPKDYNLKALQNKKVTFRVKANKIEEVIKQPIDDKLAAKVGPFKDLKALKEDVKKQVKQERENQARQIYEEQLIKSLAAKSKLHAPESLIEEQIGAVLNEFKQNLTYRGQTYQEYLKSNELTEETHKEKEVRPVAEERIKVGLVLSELADAENISVTEEEVEIRMQILKSQYKDPKMQAELEKLEARREVASRLLTEKTIAKLVSYNK